MISIIVPVYNAEKYIEQTIETVVQQTYGDWELILVDDCSQDQSLETARRKIHQYGDKESVVSRIHVIEKKVNEGAAMARNTGLDHAHGRYIAFLDADDVWYPQKLQREMDFMKQMDAGFVFTSYQFGDEEANPTGKAVMVPETFTYKEALTRTIIFTSTVLFDTRKIDKSLLYMPHIASEDTATWWQILKTGVVANGLNEQLVIYRRPPASLSSNKWKAVKRIWGLYRKIAGLPAYKAFFYMFGWAWNATMRRI